MYLSKNKRCLRAVTLIETVIGVLVMGMFLGGLYSVNGSMLARVRADRETMTATRMTNSRAEQLRSATWDQVTDPAFLRDSVLGTLPNASDWLAQTNETITVATYLSNTTLTPIQVERTANRTPTIIDIGSASIASQKSLRVTLSVTWTGAGNRSRNREMCLIVTKGGITGRH